MLRMVWIAGLLLLAVEAGAHSRSESWSEWRVGDDSLAGIVTVPAREVTRLPAAPGSRLPELFARYLAARVTATGGGCRLVAAEPLPADTAYVRVSLEFDCTGPPLTVSLPILFAEVQGHTHFARRAGSFAESVLSEDDHRFPLTPGAAAPRSHFLGYLVLGLRHILSGADHLAFLLALLLAAARWRNMLIAITGFTVGHSITLSLAVTGVLQASAPRVEALIGFTIALVAAETVALRDGYWRSLALGAVVVAAATGLAAYGLAGLPARELAAYAGLALFSGCYLLAAGRVDDRKRRGGFLGAVAVLFGLIHGLGFAGFLLETGLPPDALLLPLAGFNIGVELGQIAAVAAVLLVAMIASRHGSPEAARLGQTLGAAVLCGLGLAWFAGRSLA